MGEKDLRYRDGKLGETVHYRNRRVVAGRPPRIIPTIREKSPTPDLLGQSKNVVSQQNKRDTERERERERERENESKRGMRVCMCLCV